MCSVRRLIYLYEILRRPKNELIVQIYTAMKESTLKNAWIQLPYKDMRKFDINMSDESISLLSNQDFKKTFFTDLDNIKKGHSKVQDITHFGLKYP